MSDFNNPACLPPFGRSDRHPAWPSPPVCRNPSLTGMADFPQALPAPLLALVTGFCVDVTEGRPPNKTIGRNDSPYIDRWFIARKVTVPTWENDYAAAADRIPRASAEYLPSELENVYLHGYHRGDADEPHDHPWPNASLVVRGWYREAIYTLEGARLGSITRRAGDIVLRSACSIHAIEETSDDCLSLFATLLKERDWGFWTADGFTPWQEFKK